MKVVGYATRESVRPGERLGFCVSVEEAQPFQFDLVRLIHGDDTPAGPGRKEEVVDNPANGVHNGHSQRIRPGSCAIVADTPTLAAGSFTVAAFVCPTLPGGSRQSIIGKLAIDQVRGWALVLDELGRPAFVLGDGESSEVLVIDQPLARGCWYSIAAGFQVESSTAWLSIDPEVTPTNSRLRAVAHGPKSVRQEVGIGAIATRGIPLIFGATGGTEDRVWHFNGKIERPRLLTGGAPSSAREVVRASVPASATIGDWDAAVAITADGVLGKLVHDVSGRDHHSLLVNGPTRAVTGVRWDSTVHDYRWAPDHYAAIHFHDDDLAGADWQPTIDLELAGDTPSGVYAGRLRTDDSEHYVVFYVRPPRGAEAHVALLMPTFSYRAYANDHCAFDVPFAQMIVGHTPVLQASDLELDRHREFGLSLYDTHRDGSGVSMSSRARPILNLAPGSSYWLSPSVWQFNADLHLVDWLTERGPRFDVLTDADLHAEGVAALAPYRVLLTGSHPEYATAAMLDALAGFLDGGGRLMYLGANGFYWVTGVDPEDPDVIEVRRWGGSQAWKAQPGEFHLATTGELGGLWRNRGRPPQQLVGVGFASEGLDRSSPYRRLVADGERGSWVFDGTGVDEGALFGDCGLVGGGAAGLELDIIDEELGTPADAVVLATSGEHSDAYFEVVEELYFNARGFSGPADPRVRADLTLVSLPSGGAVFSTGSIAWCGALSSDGYDNPVSRLMSNVIERFLDPDADTLSGSDRTTAAPS